MSAVVKFIPSHRIDRQLLLLLIAFALGLYLRTLAPGLLSGDPGEFQFAAWRLGLAHPTGYPLYLLLGSAWQHLLAFVGVDPAAALNAFSAVIGALAVALLYIIMQDWLRGAPAVRRAAAFFSAFFFAANPTFWSQNLIAEVYTLHVLFILLIFRSVQRIILTGDRADSLPSSSPPLLPYILPFLLLGLALTHHGMTLLLIPGLLLALWLRGEGQQEHLFSWRPTLIIGALLATILPLALYLYIPLRSGPAASPWYHQRLGTETLVLYQNNWQSFVDFITGRSISVGFHSWQAAIAKLPEAWLLWRLHFNWPGLILMALGIFVLVRQRNWRVLALTGIYGLLQQAFNLFYAIDDILVYYIPLYLIGAIWTGFAANALGNGAWGTQPAPSTSPNTQPATKSFTGGLLLVLLLFLLPLRLISTYLPTLNQSQSTTARQMWETILAAQPPADAILISNDRNEIVPLFYLQAVEKQVTTITGLFPLLAPDARFTDIGSTVETALTNGNGRPVYLIKPMPGLEVKFAITPATQPLVQVMGRTAINAPTIPVDQVFGPLQLLGYDWQPVANGVRIDLHWAVRENLPADYTSTVQLLDANGAKIAQDDHAPGGTYYPTSRWKPGEILLDSHILTLPADQQPTTLLVGMYVGPDFTPLAPPLRIDLSAE